MTLQPRVGTTGRAIRLDIVDEMCERARNTAAAAGVDGWTESVHGEMEDIPLPDGSPDVGRVQRRAQPLGAEAALYPLFTAEVIEAMRRTILPEQQHHVATAVIVKGSKPQTQ